MKLNTLSHSMRLALAGMAILGACVGTSSAWALGLGQAKVQSAIGEALVADIELLTDPADLATLRLSLAPASEYQVQGVAFNPALVDARVEIKKNEDGKSVARIVTKSGIQDAYVQVILDGETSAGKVRRTYSLFIDLSSRTFARLPGEGALSEVSRPIVRLPAIKGAKFADPIPSPANAFKEAVARASSGERLSGIDVVLTNVVQTGDVPKHIDIVKVSGHNESIQSALFAIVPKGWNGYATDPAVKFSGTVDWQKNRDWLSVLDGVLSTAQLMGTVNWEKKEVVFSSLRASSTDPVVAQGSSADSVARVPDVSVSAAATPSNIVPAIGEPKGLAQAQQNIESLRAELAQLRDTTSGPAAANQALIQQIEELKGKQRSLESDLEASRASLAWLQANAKASVDVQTAQKEDIRTQDKRTEELKAELESTKASLVAMQERLDTANSYAEHYHSQSRGVEAALHRSEDRVTALLQEVQAAQQSQRKKAALETDAQRMDTENDGLRQELAQAKAQIAATGSAEAQAGTKVVDAEAHAAELDAAIAVLKSQIDELGVESGSRALVTIAQAKQIAATGNAEAQADAKVVDAEAHAAELGAAIAVLKSQIDELGVESGSRALVTIAQAKQIATLQAALAEAKAKATGIDSAELVALKARAEGADSAAANAASLDASQSAKIADLQTALASAKEQMDAAMARDRAADPRRAEMATTIAELQSRIETMGTNGSSLAAAQARQIAELRAALTIAMDQTAAMNTQSAPVRTDVKAPVEAVVYPSVPPEPTLRAVTLSGPIYLPSVVTNSGMSVALPSAIMKLVPGDWMITTESRIPNVPVGWKGDSRSWIQVLDELLYSNGLKAHIETDQREVRVGR